MRALRSLLLWAGSALIWPAYLGLLAYAVRVGPWPRTVARPAAFLLGALAASAFAAALIRSLLRPGGWAESVLRMPADAARLLRQSATVLLGAALALLIPRALLESGLIAPGDRPVQATELCRVLTLAFEVTAWCVAFRLGRRRSALVGWMTRHTEALGWLGRRRRPLHWAMMAALAVVIALDAAGYGFTARRVSKAGAQSAGLLVACWGTYRLIAGAIDRHAWRWRRAGPAAAATSTSAPAAAPAPATAGTSEPGGPEEDDRADRLRRLAAWAVPIAGLAVGAWVWGFNAELFRTLGEYHVWVHQGGVALTVGDLARATVVLLVTAAAWRHLGDLFALLIFPRLPEDQGMRFAVLTLARYLVLGLGLMAGLSSVHLGLKEIGVVLAALGVGLGFGLQEIVSNFVSGIILLLERPIRVGDVVTVGGQTGVVDRINIRATTIINGDNQSIIIPNRAFITGELINWTHKNKVVRATVRLTVAHGTEPDRVADLLLTIAREDADVLRNPVPAAMMESFGDFGLAFVLFVHVPEPGLAGRVKHRLHGEIQRRFAEAGIVIPLPSRAIHVHPAPRSAAAPSPSPSPAPAFDSRFDDASPTPPTPRFAAVAFAPPEPVNRCVDE